METITKDIRIGTTINVPIERVWDLWTRAFHIIHWNLASDDWQTTYAENDPVTGGSFLSRMEARDGSEGFDFGGTYEDVKKYQHISYRLDDGRRVDVEFASKGDSTSITETFEPESTNPVEMQRSGWQAILDNFKKYAESYGQKDVVHYEVEINAAPGKVYQRLTDKKYYSEWTAEFNPGAYYEGSWKKGTEIRFLGPDQEGDIGGMISRVKENIPGKFLSVEHQGYFSKGKMFTGDDDQEGWGGSLENYTFTGKGNKTILSVDMDIVKKYRQYFDNTWPKALLKLKEICER